MNNKERAELYQRHRDFIQRAYEWAERYISSCQALGCDPESGEMLPETKAVKPTKKKRGGK